MNHLDLILEEWVASLKNKDRSSAAVEGNFDDFFESLKNANATFEEAHALMPKAVKAHLAAPAVVRNTYKAMKHAGKMGDTTEKEFTDSWNKDIADKGTNSLYAFFPRPKAPDEDDDGEPKVYGSMSVKEYRSQRRHADQYPILDTEALEQRVQTGTYNPMENIADILGNKKGDNGDSK